MSSMKKGQSTDSAGKVDVALQLHEEFQSLSLKNGKPLKIILIRILLWSPQILFVQSILRGNMEILMKIIPTASSKMVYV